MRTNTQPTGSAATERSTLEGDYERSVHLADTDARVALERATAAFGQEGFGVIAEIDLRDLMMRRLNKSVSAQWVLEICNPSLADRALALGHVAGLFIPCRVSVWQQGRDAVVAVLRPVAFASLMGSQALQAIAGEAERHIDRALLRLAVRPDAGSPTGDA